MEDIKKRLIDHDKRIRFIELKMTEVGGDVKHIKDRIDNGLSSTMTKIFTRIDEIFPAVKENSYWVSKIKGAFVWVSVIGIGGET